MVVFLWTLIGICGTMLLLQMAIVSYNDSFLFCLDLLWCVQNYHFSVSQDTNDSILLVMSFTLLCWSLILAFIPCELGKRTSDAFVEINDMMDQFVWHLFRIEIVKMLLIILITVQQPVEVICIGSISCTRETFKKVSCQNSMFQMALNVYFIWIWIWISLIDHQIRIQLFYGTSFIWKMKLRPSIDLNMFLENFEREINKNFNTLSPCFLVYPNECVDLKLISDYTMFANCLSHFISYAKNLHNNGKIEQQLIN